MHYRFKHHFQKIKKKKKTSLNSERHQTIKQSSQSKKGKKNP